MIIIQPPVNSIIVGKIIGAYGVLGWVKIVSFTHKSDDIFNYSPWFVLYQSKWKLMSVDNWRITKKYYIAKVSGISNRELAMSFSQSKLIINSAHLPPLCNNEYYWKDIIGCTVITVMGSDIGHVVNIIESTAHDILVIQMGNNRVVYNRDCLIPFVEKKIIKDVNLITRVIIVDWDI